MADIIRAAGGKFIDKNRSWLHGGHLKVLTAIERCRTAALGGHRDQCANCGHQSVISYNSCRNRHCPKCQTNARNRWIAARSAELLPVEYAHVVFTLPHRLAPLVFHNKKLLYGLLFRASAQTLLEVAAHPKRLGAELGFFSVLHTWGQTLEYHPHVHCVIPTGGLAPDRQRWIHAPKWAKRTCQKQKRFFLHVRVLGEVFRGKFIDGLKQSWRQKELCLPGPLKALAQEKTFRAFLRTLHRNYWVVYSKPPFGGPEHVLHYLARYTHRVAISNHRIVNFAEDQVSFRWKDYAHGSQQRVMTLSADEFLRRFLQHILPKRFVRIRSFGFLANRQRTESLTLCRQLLHATAPSPEETESREPTWRCPHCGGPMVTIERLTAAQLQKVLIDTS